MEWTKRMNQAIAYIEEHLKEELINTEIEKIAACSIYNFQRLFSYIADQPLSEYIRHRRLTLAAFDLLNTKQSILEIANIYGYTSQDAFTRAFRKFHGVLPSQVREHVVNLRACPQIVFQSSMEGDHHMQYQIETWPAFVISGIKQQISTQSAFEQVPQIWDQATKDGTLHRLLNLCLEADMRPSGLLGLAIGGEWGDSEKMQYMMGVTTHVAAADCQQLPCPQDMTEFHLPEATWVVINADGPLPDAVQRVYHSFYKQWLPSSGYELADLPVIECYMQDQRQEVWIAVEPGTSL